MKLKYQFVVMDMDGEFAAVPVGDGSEEFRGMLRLNATSADILKQLQEDTTPDKVHQYLKEKYPESTDREIGESLVEFLNRLVAEGLLIAP
jgi:uncharacterized protein YehS (DUF1456 family)